MNIEGQQPGREALGSIDEKTVESLVEANLDVIDGWARRYARPEKGLDADELGGIGRAKAVEVAQKYLRDRVQGSFRNYLWTAVKRVYTDAYRARGVDIISLEDPSGDEGLTVRDSIADLSTVDPETEVLRHEQIEMVRATIRTLSPEHRAVIALDMQEYSYQEMADILGEPIGTIRSRISRGYKRLRKALEAHPYLNEEE